MIDSNNQSIINDSNNARKMNIEIFLETFIIYSQKDLSPYKDPNTPNPRHPLLLTDLKKDTLIGDGLKEYPIIAQKANMDFHPMWISYNHEPTTTRMEKTKKTKTEKNKEIKIKSTKTKKKYKNTTKNTKDNHQQLKIKTQDENKKTKS